HSGSHNLIHIDEQIARFHHTFARHLPVSVKSAVLASTAVADTNAAAATAAAVPAAHARANRATVRADDDGATDPGTERPSDAAVAASAGDDEPGRARSADHCRGRAAGLQLFARTLSVGDLAERVARTPALQGNTTSWRRQPERHRGRTGPAIGRV